MSHLLSKANHTAQWYQPSYPNAEVFSHLEKFVLHSTETEGWPSYDGGAKAPNATYHPRLREIRQHFYSDRSSRALQDPDSTLVRENRDDVFQLEIVAYSCKSCADQVGGLWIANLTPTHIEDIADIIVELHEDLQLPTSSTVKWAEGDTGDPGLTRLTSSQYDAYRGILAHMHVPGNSHYDVGGFRYSRLETAIEERMGLSSEDKVWLSAEIKKQAREALKADMGYVSPGVAKWAADNGLDSNVEPRRMEEYIWKEVYTGDPTAPIGNLPATLKRIEDVLQEIKTTVNAQ